MLFVTHVTIHHIYDYFIFISSFYISNYIAKNSLGHRNGFHSQSNKTTKITIYIQSHLKEVQNPTFKKIRQGIKRKNSTNPKPKKLKKISQNVSQFLSVTLIIINYTVLTTCFWHSSPWQPGMLTAHVASPCHVQTMSFSAGLTSSSQNFAYSKVSPADFENSTTATSGATSNTSAVTASLPFLPTAVPWSRILKSFTSATVKLSPLAAAAILATIATAENLEVNTAAVFRLASNSPERSKPEDMEEMNSKALKNLGTLELLLPSSVTASCLSTWHVSATEYMYSGRPLRNQGTRVMAEMVVLLAGSATRIFEINLLDSGENHGGNSNSALRTLLYMVIRFSCWKGRKPARRTYRTTPHDQISAFEPA